MTEEHVHKFTKSALKDRYFPNKDGSQGIRYLLVWKCDCGYTEAYDLTHEQPILNLSKGTS